MEKYVNEKNTETKYTTRMSRNLLKNYKPSQDTFPECLSKSREDAKSSNNIQTKQSTSPKDTAVSSQSNSITDTPQFIHVLRTFEET